MIKIIEAVLPEECRAQGRFQIFDLRGATDGRRLVSGPWLRLLPSGVMSSVVVIDDGQGPTGAIYEKFNTYFGQSPVEVFR